MKINKVYEQSPGRQNGLGAKLRLISSLVNNTAVTIRLACALI
jgi:hypothetical protein